MEGKRQVKAKELVADIHSGMSDVSLMTKYKLSMKGLQSSFQKLLEAGVLAAQDFVARPKFFEDTVIIDLDSLSLDREPHLVCLLPISDHDRPGWTGTVCEIGENGVLIKGLGISVGDVRTFTIDPGDFFHMDPFSFEARCIQRKKSAHDESDLAGFEIVSIANEDRENLRRLIRKLKP